MAHLRTGQDTSQTYLDWYRRSLRLPRSRLLQQRQHRLSSTGCYKGDKQALRDADRKQGNMEVQHGARALLKSALPQCHILILG